MEITGTIIKLNASELVGKNQDFKKRLVVIETNEKYPQKLAVDFIKDGCDKLDKYAEGMQVKISINLRGQEYKEKFYVSLQGWKIEDADGKTHAKPENNSDSDFNDDGLPF